MTLYDEWLELSDELDKASQAFSAYVAIRPASGSVLISTFEDECLLEGILSRVWQAWCEFCRDCVIGSCVGTIDGNGLIVPPHPLAASETHVSAASLNAKNGRRPVWVGSNTLLRLEPTWGDVDVLSRILTELAPANSAQLLASFSVGHRPVKALQRVRNAAAHNHHQNLADVIALAPGYVAHSITHPVHALLWVEPSSRDYMFYDAIEGMRETALLAIS